MSSGVHAHASRMSFTDVKIKTPNRRREMGPGGVNDVTHWKRGLKFEKKQWVEFLPRKKTVDFRSSPRSCGGCRTWFGTDGKVSIERLCLSPYVEKPFNSKVIKSFVPELRSRKVFRVSGFLFYIYVCAIDILCTFHIFMYGYVIDVVGIFYSPGQRGSISMTAQASLHEHRRCIYACWSEHI